MSYMKIPNLYKDQTVLMFKKVWALEKIHGVTAWATFNGKQPLQFHAGGASKEVFKGLFDEKELHKKLLEIFGPYGNIRIHGEHYGGKIQKMSQTYGKEHHFTVFDIKVGDCWISFDKVQELCRKLGLDVVDGIIVDAEIDVLNAVRDSPSVQSVKNGIEGEHVREGIVIRPLIELIKNNGKRVIAKHKNAAFRETKTPREVSTEDMIKNAEILRDANAIADEWVTAMRLNHVLDNFNGPHEINLIPLAIKAMIADIEIEASGEIELSNSAKKAIGRATANLFKKYLDEMDVEQ